MAHIPPCPRCGRRKAKELSGGYFQCQHCQAFFDDNPDEGGDYSADPSKRIEREESRRKPRR